MSEVNRGKSEINSGSEGEVGDDESVRPSIVLMRYD